MKKHILKLYSNKYTMKNMKTPEESWYEWLWNSNLSLPHRTWANAYICYFWIYMTSQTTCIQDYPIPRKWGYISKTMSIWGKRTLYQVTSPKILALRAADIQKQTAIIIPELEAIYEKSLDRPKLTIKEWIDWIRSIHSDLIHSLPKWGISYRYSSSNREFEERTLYVPDDYFDIQKEKNSNGILSRAKSVVSIENEILIER